MSMMLTVIVAHTQITPGANQVANQSNRDLIKRPQGDAVSGFMQIPSVFKAQ
jgi:hypothetical protein